MSWDFPSGPVVKIRPSNAEGGVQLNQGPLVQFLVKELRSHVLWCAAKIFLKFCLSKFLHLLVFSVLPWLYTCHLEMTKDSYLKICFFIAILASFSI